LEILPAPPGRGITDARDSEDALSTTFLQPERYDLSKVGRLKLNYKFYRDLPEDQRPSLDTAVLTPPKTFLETVRHSSS